MEVDGERIPRAALCHFGVKNKVLHLNRANRFHALSDTPQKRRNVVLSGPGGIRLGKVLRGPFFHHSVFDLNVPISVLPGAVADLKAHSNGPDVFELQRCFLPHELALVPGNSSRGVNELFHDRLPFGE